MLGEVGAKGLAGGVRVVEIPVDEPAEFDEVLRVAAYRITPEAGRVAELLPRHPARAKSASGQPLIKKLPDGQIAAGTDSMRAKKRRWVGHQNAR